MKLHEKISYYRKNSGLSQEALAELLGVSRQAVSKWETGDSQPELSNLLAMARTFGVTTDHLLSDEDAPMGEKAASARTKTSTKAFGIISTLVKRFGWLAGVYVAFSGVPMLIVGIVMRVIAISSDDMFEGFSQTTVSTVSMISNPIEIISLTVLGIGCALILGGIILTVYLKKKLK